MSPPPPPAVGGPDVGVLEHEALLEGHRGGGGVPAERSRSRRGPWLVATAVAVGASVAAVVGGTDVVNAAGWPQLRRFLAAAAEPDLSGSFLALTARATLTTLAYAVLGTLGSLVIGIVGGVAASEAWWRATGAPAPAQRWQRGRGWWLASRVGLAVPRGIHEAVWGLLLLAVLGLDPLVAVLAIALPYGAVTAKVFAEILDDQPPEVHEALLAAGAGRARSVLYGLLPRALPEMISYGFYRFECSIRAAAILGIVGAGGLGFELALSFQSLRYEQMWTLLAALVVTSGAADWWGARVRARLRDPVPARRRDPVLSASLVAVVGLGVLSWTHLALDVGVLWSSRAVELGTDLLGRAWPPRLGPGGWGELVGLSLETVAMSVAAMALAAGGGAVAAVAVARRPGTGPLRRLAGGLGRGVLLVCRAVPPPVGALLVLFVLYPGPLPGAVALAVYNLGILGRLMAESLENLDEGPRRALRHQGATGSAAFLYAEVPRAAARFAAYGVYRWEVTIRETVVVGLVGAGGLGRAVAEQLAAFDYAALTTTLAALVVLTVLVDLAGSGLRRAIR